MDRFTHLSGSWTGGSRRVRLSAFLMLIFSVGAVSISLKMFAPYLSVELARFNYLDIIRIFIFDFISVFAFTGFCLLLMVKGELPKPAVFDKRMWKYLIIAPLFMLAVDFAFTSYSVYKEWAAWKSSAKTIGRVIDIRTESNKYVDKYHVTYEYSDAEGNRFTGLTRVNDLHNAFSNRVIQEDLSLGFIERVRKREVPFELSVRYSPDWPAKCWPDNLGWDGDGDTLLSLMLYFYPCYLIFFLLSASIGYAVIKKSKGWGYVILSTSAILSQIVFFFILAVIAVGFRIFDVFSPG